MKDEGDGWAGGVSWAGDNLVEREVEGGQDQVKVNNRPSPMLLQAAIANGIPVPVNSVTQTAL